MSPLARWCHRHRLAVVLAWVGLLLTLGAGAGAAGSAFGNSPTSQNTDHANRAMTELGARDRAQLVVIAYETGPVRAGRRADPGTASTR